MSHDQGAFRLRRVDIGLIIAVLTLAGMVMGYAKKPAQWDQTTDEVGSLKKVVWNNKSRVDVLETKVDYIVKTLDRIDRKLDR